MKTSDTPETDAAMWSTQTEEDVMVDVVNVEFAEKLERERDAAVEYADKLRELLWRVETDYGGAYCNDIDDQNWFDYRNKIAPLRR